MANRNNDYAGGLLPHSAAASSSEVAPKWIAKPRLMHTLARLPSVAWLCEKHHKSGVSGLPEKGKNGTLSTFCITRGMMTVLACQSLTA